MTLTRPAADEYAIETVHRADDFDALADEWHALYRSAPRATPFQSHAWLRSWWRAYGHDGQLRVVLVRGAGGRLVAAAPLYLRHNGPIRVLGPVGGALSDFTDLLVAEDVLPAAQVPCVLSTIVAGLAAVPGWDVVDLPEVRPGGVAEQLEALWTGPRWVLKSSTCMELPVPGLDDLLGRLSKKRASEVRRRLRRADELGLEVAAVPADEVAEGISDLIRLHSRQWHGRGINPEHVRPRFSAHLRLAIGCMVRQREALLSRIHLNGELVAVTLDLVGHRMIFGYLMGVAPELYEKVDVTAYVLGQEMARVSERRLGGFSMLRGRESYKRSWRPETIVNRRVILGRPGAPSAYGFGLAAWTLARARAVARRRAPWIAELRRRLTALTTPHDRS